MVLSQRVLKRAVPVLQETDPDSNPTEQIPSVLFDDVASFNVWFDDPDPVFQSVSRILALGDCRTRSLSHSNSPVQTRLMVLMVGFIEARFGVRQCRGGNFCWTSGITLTFVEFGS